MKRRHFFRTAGLGMTGLFLAQSLLAGAGQKSPGEEETIQFTLDYLTQNGAKYADARIGKAAITGKTDGFLPPGLFRENVLGVRVCTREGWLHALISDTKQKPLLESLEHILRSEFSEFTAEKEWVSAAFEQHLQLNSGTTDKAVESEIQKGWMRFGNRPVVPTGTANLLYCDVLILH